MKGCCSLILKYTKYILTVIQDSALYCDQMTKAITSRAIEMITKQEPAQPKLWSRFQDLLSEAALEELDRGWQGVFHRMILNQLPIELMAEKFNKYTGRPTKELYSVCGLLLIMNYFGWTLSQAL